MKNQQRVSLFNIFHPSSIMFHRTQLNPYLGTTASRLGETSGKHPCVFVKGEHKWPTVWFICRCRSSKQELDSTRQGEATPGFSHCGQSQKPHGSPYLIHQKLASTSNALPVEAAWAPRVPGTHFAKHIWFVRWACGLQG